MVHTNQTGEILRYGTSSEMTMTGLVHVARNAQPCRFIMQRSCHTIEFVYIGIWRWHAACGVALVDWLNVKRCTANSPAWSQQWTTKFTGHEQKHAIMGRMDAVTVISQDALVQHTHAFPHPPGACMLCPQSITQCFATALPPCAFRMLDHSRTERIPMAIARSRTSRHKTCPRNTLPRPLVCSKPAPLQLSSHMLADPSSSQDRLPMLMLMMLKQRTGHW